MTQKLMITLFILMSMGVSIASGSDVRVNFFDQYGDDDDDKAQGESSSSSSSEKDSNEPDERSASISESNYDIEDPGSYPYVLEIVAKNTRNKVATSFMLEGTQMTVLSDEHEPVKPETIAFLKKNGVMKTDHVPQDWSAKVINLYPSKMPKPMAQLAVGKFVLFYGDSVRVGDVVSCAHMLEISGPKDAWKVSDKRFYMAWGPYGAFLDYHHFVEPRELERQRDEEQRREDERKKQRKKGKKSRHDEYNYDPYAYD